MFSRTFSSGVLLLIAACILSACGGKSKKSMKGDEEVSMTDFVEFFDEIKLPYAFRDTLIRKKGSDSILISNDVFRKFISDSMFMEVYGKKEKPKIYAVGAYRNKEEETYLCIRTKGSTDAAWLIAVTKEMKPSASMLLMAGKGKAADINLVNLDNKYTITLADEYKNPDGSLATYSTVYAYNTAGLFMEIMHDGLKRGEELAILNPIDTFPAKFARSGNYQIDKKNFLTIRDGDSAKTFLFFMNVNKGKDCVTELKGEAKWIKKDSATYISGGDGCTIGFKFNNNGVRVSEVEGCMSRRSNSCSFNASYRKVAMPKKKEDVKKASKKK